LILVDTSIWAEHIDREVEALAALLRAEPVLVHPFVTGELAMGNLRQRDRWLRDLQLLPQATVAAHGETMQLVERHRLFGRGIGYVDAHLLAATRLSPESLLWTFDQRLHAAAIQLRLAYEP
jgi:predicted nucleic acid-binding protein